MSLIFLILSPLAPPFDKAMSISFGVHLSSLAIKMASRLTVVILLNFSIICIKQEWKNMSYVT